MGFLESIERQVLKFYQNCLAALDHADLAVMECKALDQLRERLVGAYGVEEIMVDETESRRYDEPVVNVLVVASGDITSLAQYYIKFVLMLVNLRYRTKFNAMFVDRKTLRSHTPS